jgi:hypothetical protein
MLGGRGYRGYFAVQSVRGLDGADGSGGDITINLNDGAVVLGVISADTTGTASLNFNLMVDVPDQAAFDALVAALITADPNGGTIDINNETYTWYGFDEIGVNLVMVAQTGSLDITKVVDWNGVQPNEAVIFEICIEGPSYLNGGCQIVDWDGGTMNWPDLIPGEYIVTEIEAIGWTTVVPPDPVIVSPGETAEAYVVNTLNRGTITVTKVVDWNGVTPDPAQTFTLCIDSGLLEVPRCGGVGYAGGPVTFGDLIPGAYSVYEVDPGAGWTASGGGSVSVSAGGLAMSTITNTHDPPACTALPGDLSEFITISGLTATGTVTNNSAQDCEYPIGVASYLKFDDIIDNQQLFASNTMTVLIPAGGSVTISVAMPECATQIDLFFGDVLPTLSGERYGSRLLAALHLPGTGYCTPP